MMLSRASALRRAVVSVPRLKTQRRTMAEAAVADAVDDNKLKFNFFLPHQTLKDNAHVVR